MFFFLIKKKKSNTREAWIIHEEKNKENWCTDSTVIQRLQYNQHSVT